MFRTLFGRLMALFVAVIIVLLIMFSFISYYIIRKTIISDRMKALKTEARDIANIAANIDLRDYFQKSSLENHLKYKIDSVQKEYGAYIITVDKNGKIIDNLMGLYKENYDFARSLDGDKVYKALLTIISGKEIESQDLKIDEVVFTVGVPFIQNNSVQGAVFIHTAEQKIKAEFTNIFLLLVGLFIVAVALSGFVAAFFTKKLTDPLLSMEAAVTDFTNGKYSRRVEEVGTIETTHLAKSFNIMANKIEQTEKNRREFVANVSHELRSPVTSINGYIKGMLDKTIPEDKINQYLCIVSEETERLTKLIEDLLTLSRLEKDKIILDYEAFNINELIRRVIITKIGVIENKNIEIDTNFENEPLMVYADKNRIMQVLNNLLDNSAKFVDNNGCINISVKTSNDKAIINFTDDGIGIKEEDLPFIFERFYKHDKSRNVDKGTGLGLSICKQIMELHNEKISALKNDNGASFEFSLQLFNKTQI
ncbi:MAG: HAMP domain-containing histidine kinase [Christensenellaceae bacterium]|nr:HAMP domain-containing histidine kinase [Christensenellaceae bacterium]